MVKKKHTAKKRTAEALSELTGTEQDLLSHMEQGYQLETDSLGSEPVLRRLKDNEVIRPASVNRSTIEALKKRGMITPAGSHDPLTIVWRLSRHVTK